MSIYKDIEKLKEVFLAGDLDSEDYQDNLDKLNEWETNLRMHEDFLAWQNHDVTKVILLRAKQAYRELGLTLAVNRSLTPEQRTIIFAKQDAITMLINLSGENSESAIKQINNEIKQALSAV